MKRALTGILSLVLAVLLAACGCAKTSNTAQVPTWQEKYDLGIRYLSAGNY